MKTTLVLLVIIAAAAALLVALVPAGGVQGYPGQPTPTIVSPLPTPTAWATVPPHPTATLVPGTPPPLSVQLVSLRTQPEPASPWQTVAIGAGLLAVAMLLFWLLAEWWVLR